MRPARATVPTAPPKPKKKLFGSGVGGGGGGGGEGEASGGSPSSSGQLGGGGGEGSTVGGGGIGQGPGTGKGGGSSSGNTSGGNDGGGDGDGDGGGGGGTCFAKGTLFEMEDGSYKAIDEFEVGDKCKGGEVTEVIQGQANSIWYDYHGTSVTDEHFVLERGVWKYVMDSEDAVKIEPRDQYFTAITSNHELFDEHGNTFSDHNVFDYYHPAMDIEGYYCDALLEMKNGNTAEARRIMMAGAMSLADLLKEDDAA